MEDKNRKKSPKLTSSQEKISFTPTPEAKGYYLYNLKSHFQKFNEYLQAQQKKKLPLFYDASGRVSTELSYYCLDYLKKLRKIKSDFLKTKPPRQAYPLKDEFIKMLNCQIEMFADILRDAEDQARTKKYDAEQNVKMGLAKFNQHLNRLNEMIKMLE